MEYRINHKDYYEIKKKKSSNNNHLLQMIIYSDKC